MNIRLMATLRQDRLRKTLLVFLCALLVVLSLQPLYLAHASNWIDEELSAEGAYTAENVFDDGGTVCTLKTVEYQNPVEECIIHSAQSFSYKGEGIGGTFVQKQDDADMLQLYRKTFDNQLVPFKGIIESVPNTDMVVLRPIPVYGKLEIIKDFAAALKVTSVENGINVYEMPFGADFTLVDSKGLIATTAGSVGISQNNRFIAVELTEDVITIIDTTTFEHRAIGFMNERYTYGLAVSNNGRYVAGVGQPYKIIRVSDGCGATFHDEILKYPECPSRSITSELAVSFGTGIYNNPRFFFPINGIKFNDDNSLTVGRRENNGMWQNTTISHDGPVEAPLASLPATKRFTYLAMGDSYSSGEGDVGRKSDGSSYYLPGTEADGACHLSGRSYPFLLREHYNIPANDMKSIACSGARVLPDYFRQSYSEYLGQNSRLRELSEQQRQDRKKDALENFVPGDVNQIEFVRKYRPEVVTLTAGGNDIGFAEVLSYCATPYMHKVGKFDIPGQHYTCNFAYPNSQQGKILYDIIDTQYELVSEMIRQLKVASPTSRIVLVGYPSFAADGVLCGPNAASLDADERDMINQAVNYTNGMLRKVALSTEISYVDVEDSLRGGRICEGSKYVTGLASLNREQLLDLEVSEIFHPNSAGHRQLANKIIASDIFDAEMPPENIDYEPATDRTRTFAYAFIPGGALYRSQDTLEIYSETDLFQPDSSVSLTMFSEPISLGQYQTDEMGYLRATLNTSDLPIGRHLLVAEGIKWDGSPLRYHQFITVSANEHDLDGDGIADEQDNCDFINEWYDEPTGQNVCAPVNKFILLDPSSYRRPNTVELRIKSENARLIADTEEDNDENVFLVEPALNLTFTNKNDGSIAQVATEKIRQPRYIMMLVQVAGIVATILIIAGIVIYRKSLL